MAGRRGDFVAEDGIQPDDVDVPRVVHAVASNIFCAMVLPMLFPFQ
jgi:hypothetical protein